jgi:hypothetical protein
MPKIFCCYRRNDSSHQAGRIFDHLALHFSKDELFKDVDSMPLGLDFRKVLTEKVVQCDVLLALIGDSWLRSADATGARRLDDPSDFVRIEIETALGRGIPVIPVLVGQAGVPRPEDLPDEMRELAYRNGQQIRPDPDFPTDIDRLIRGIFKVLGAKAPAPRSRTAPPAAPAIDPNKSGFGPRLGAASRSYLLDKVLKTAPRGSAATPPGAGQTQDPTVRIGILKSGNATYVEDIERSLRLNLDVRLTGRRLRTALSHDMVEWGDESQWATAVTRLMARGGEEGFRFLVGIGTQAAVALQDSLGAEFGKVPTVLLGVTYPRIAGLVDSEHFRCEKSQVVAVRYGCGLDAVASLLYHRIFPGRKLCFVYQAGIPQDDIAAAELATTRLARTGLLRLLRLDRRLRAEDLEDREMVYFSWYTFTRLFHDTEFSILRNRLTVSIMRDNVQDGAASVGVGTDHDWIGDRGAELIAEHLAAPEGARPDWGTRDVIISPLVYWLNRSLARKHGIEFSPEALRGAGEVYD